MDMFAVDDGHVCGRRQTCLR